VLERRRCRLPEAMSRHTGIEVFSCAVVFCSEVIVASLGTLESETFIFGTCQLPLGLWTVLGSYFKK